ncbi:hypothetical protein D3C86_1144600 [compost metagenome]
MIEVIDGILQFAEKALLLLALRRDVGDLEDVQPLAARILQHPALQPVPVRPRIGIPAQRFQQPEFFVAIAAFAQHVDEPVKRFGGFPAARQKRLEALDIARLRGAAHAAIGGVGIDHMPLGVGNQRTFGVSRQEAAGKPIRLRLRHDLDEADDRRHQKEDAHHRQHAENAEHDFVFQRILEIDKGGGSRDQNQRQKQNAQHRAGTGTPVHQRKVVVACLAHPCHLGLAVVQVVIRSALFP